MKTTWTLAAALMLAGGSIEAGKLANGLEFRTPDGWTVKSNDKAAVLLPPDLVMEPGGKEPSEAYLLGVEQGVGDLRDPQLPMQQKFFPAGATVRPAGPRRTFQAAGGTGYLYIYDALSQGIPLRINIYVVGLSNGDVAGLVAVARPGLMTRREPVVFALATSLSRQAVAAAAPAPAANGTLAAGWDQRLRGKKLHQFSSYSGSYGSGGMSSQKTLFLAADGSYSFRSSSSVSIYTGGANGGSASQNSALGRWRIYEQGGSAVLELLSNAGVTEKIVLTSNGSKTLLNGRQWLVGD